MKDSHLSHFLILVIGLTLDAVLFYIFRDDFGTKVAIAAAGSLFYALWGIIHHALEGRLSRLTVWEYILFGLLAFLLLLTAISL